MRRYKRFTLLLLAATACLLLAASALCVVADPFGVWRLDRATGIQRGNENYEHIFKPYVAYALRPEVIFLGNSRVSWGFPAWFGDRPAGSVYNLGVAGATLPEMAAYLDFALNTFGPKDVVLGLNRAMFTTEQAPYREGFSLSMLADSQKGAPWHLAHKIQDTCLSMDTLKKALAGLAAPRTQERYVFGLRIWKPVERTAFDLEDRVASTRTYDAMFEPYHKLAVLPERMEMLREMAGACAARGARLHLFVECKTVFDWIARERQGRMEDFMAWKKAVAAMHPLWDFSGLNEVTLGFRPEDFYEVSHVTPRVGRLMLSAMAGEPSALGTLLTPDNVDAVLQAQREDFERYRSTEHYRTFSRHNPEAFARLLDGEIPAPTLP